MVDIINISTYEILNELARRKKSKILIYSVVGANIKKLRTEKGLSQSDLADMIGVTRISVLQYEKGTQKIQLHVLSLICEMLGTTFNEITKPLITIKEGED